ncbi:MAG: hypothetical protein FWG11_02675 [Promicromonosporaceae bacterium]|nr:hypothetical protein [Promicromonosporaceae bacterium]
MTEQIVVRNLPRGTKAKLRARGTLHGRPGAESEARAILNAVLLRDEPIDLPSPWERVLQAAEDFRVDFGGIELPERRVYPGYQPRTPFE